MKQKRGNNFPLKSEDYERKRLEVNFWLILGISLGLTVLIYALVLPIRESFLGILLYERGFTQYIAIWFACIVITVTVIKFIKLNGEFLGLKRLWISDKINFDNPQSLEVLTFQKSLIRENSLVALRCSRVIGAYIESNSRKTATEFALDDSSFYVSNSESSFAFPRILIWAIPLLGFIGTVVGISQAVNGFSGFLEQSGDVEQIKEGIGTVTSGLAVAFDTTLLALLLSVLVMIPLVLVERYESRLLLSIDIFINDQLLPRFKPENNPHNTLDPETINQALNQAVKDHFPTPQDLIEPAHNYAQQAVTKLTEILGSELSGIQKVNEILMAQLNQINQLSLQDRDSFTNSVERQQEINQDVLRQINSLVQQLNLNYTDLSGELTEQIKQLILQEQQSFTNSLERQQENNQDVVTQVKGLVQQLNLNYTDLSGELTEQIKQLILQEQQSFTNSLERQQENNQDVVTQVKGLVEQLNLNYSDLSKELTEQIKDLILQDKHSFTTALEKQQDLNQNLIITINGLVEQLKNSYSEISAGLTDQSDEIAQQLKLAANLLENRIKSLENATDKLSELTQLQGSLDQLVQSLGKVETVEQVILEAMTQLKGLQPSLEKLSKPRIIKFVESDELGD
ncbi:hypothetical protein PCC7424_4099 [Gloeothece citriformis PCC 7424]|uniref:MotA/TolQ/ExbB proton channel domain-containing protein n=1 Tax=Gloeothece citriformis (strain PCC 7424) TaxID=65393 RepID=B7KLA0_GLOC7|nr:MotA/TolQ/ExbB proton channel family protein [Gloeothece citriformis]ACK72472.1 hypothetical protein PCC7424_4099 [Gloeothece citriformis PCC 7424]